MSLHRRVFQLQAGNGQCITGRASRRLNSQHHHVRRSGYRDFCGAAATWAGALTAAGGGGMDRPLPSCNCPSAAAHRLHAHASLPASLRPHPSENGPAVKGQADRPFCRCRVRCRARGPCVPVQLRALVATLHSAEGGPVTCVRVMSDLVIFPWCGRFPDGVPPWAVVPAIRSWDREFLMSR